MIRCCLYFSSKSYFMLPCCCFLWLTVFNVGVLGSNNVVVLSLIVWLYNKEIWLWLTGGHALRAGPAQSLSPLVSPSEGELTAPLSPSSGPALDSLGPSSSTSATPSVPPTLKDNPTLAEFAPMLTQGWAEIFIRRPSGMSPLRMSPLQLL